jgi:glycosyltransferase involved in cell wall biosynthesis
MDRVIYIATEYSGGMRPYALAVLKSVWNSNSFVFIVIKDDVMMRDFADFPADRVLFIHYPTSKIKRLLFRIYPAQLIRAVNHLMQNEQFDLIHTLTGELVLASCFTRLSKKIKILHTIHDAIHHDTKYLSVKQALKDLILVDYPNKYIIKHADNILTNSKSQLSYLHDLYPRKHCFYCPFPSLINPDIEHGSKQVPELIGVNNYILFFGNLQLYKGVHLLYDLHHYDARLNCYPLVIAGAGNIYFSRNQDEKNTFFVNRFIRDDEIRDLFINAAVVVYPYISATQTGVLSVASYFGKKMVLSNIPFFRDSGAGDYSGVKIADVSDADEFAADIINAITSEEGNTFEFYRKAYSKSSIKKQISEIYNEF